MVLSCCCSVAKSGLTLWGPMNCIIPGFPVLHLLLEFAQIMNTEDSEGQGSLVCCSPWGCKELDSKEIKPVNPKGNQP